VRDAIRPLAGYTTLRLGGPADRLVEATDERAVAEALRVASGPLFVLAGGSNVVIGDGGVRGTVLLLRTSGVQPRRDGERLVVRVAAGEPWDGVVAQALAEGWSGLECLSGIPGSAGATPIQNVGAYGREVAEMITSVRAFDRQTGEFATYAPTECDFGYRTSVFKYSDRWIVLSVDFRLERSARSAPIRYPELAAALGVPVGTRTDAAQVREAVLKLRAGKGMVLDADDPDTYSVGSFFTNPVLPAADFAALAERAGPAGPPPGWPVADGTVKTSAAWLIEKAGFGKGYGRDGVAISTKHTLALTNRGTGTTAALLDLAREIRAGVRDRFGITLHPEPVLVGCALSE
jgi:UDP-N-acetylmuramate dehydrogenase